MRDQRNDNFWADVFKWFLIWNLLSLLVRGFVFVCKTILIAISQLVYFIAIGIKKLIPIAKNKKEEKRKNKALKKMYKPKKYKESDFALKAKKVKYWVIDFFYSYEFQILTFGILAIAIVIALIVFNVTTK